MKKIIILFSFILVFITGCSKSEKIQSLNQVFEYELLDEWQEMTDFKANLTEISLQKSDNSIGLMAEYVNYKNDSPEKFVEDLKNSFEHSGAIFEKDFSYDKNDRKINAKIFKVSEENPENKFIVGSMQINKNKDGFVGFMSTAINVDNYMDEITSALNAISFTGKYIENERHIIPNTEYFEFDLPPNYRRLNKISETSFIKNLDGNFIILSMKTLRKDVTPLEDELKKLNKNNQNNLVVDEEILKNTTTENFKDKDIYTKISKLNDFYQYAGIIDFKNTNLMVSYNFNISTKEEFEKVENELKNLVDSIKLKNNAEKLIEKDAKKLKKEIEKQLQQNKKELELEKNKLEENSSK